MVWKKLAGLLPSWLIPAPLFIMCLTWAAHFWLSPSFGLYEDDYTFIPGLLGAGPAHVLGQASAYIAALAGHGRPLQGAITMVLASFSWWVGGLQGIYLAGFLILSLNAMLFYSLLRRLTGPWLAAVAVTAYVLFPADTTHPFLTHALGLQPALTMLLVGLHAFRSNRQILGYVMALLTLFTYETVFPLFLTAPLFCQQPECEIPLRMLRNGGILAAILLGVTLLRTAVGEARISTLRLGPALMESAEHTLIGPLVGFGAFFYKAGKVLLSLDAGLAVAATLGAVAFYMLLYSYAPMPPRERLKFKLMDFVAAGRDLWRRGLWSGKTGRPEEGPRVTSLLQLLIIGALMLVLVYPLTLTTDPIALVSRGTRVHFAAVVGASLLFAAVSGLAIRWVARGWWRRFMCASVAVVFGLSLAYDITVQRDYVRAWSLQREFWSGVLASAPDLTEGTVVLVDGMAPNQPLQIGANTWAVPRILPQLYEFPDTWADPPRAYQLVPDWEGSVVSSTGEFQLDGRVVLRPADLFVTIPPGRTILLRWNGPGEFSRPETVRSDGVDLGLKADSANTVDSLRPTALHDLLVPARANEPLAP